MATANATILAQLEAIHEKVFYAVAVEGDSPAEVKGRLTTDELDLAFSVTGDNFTSEELEEIVWAKQDIFNVLHSA